MAADLKLVIHPANSHLPGSKLRRFKLPGTSENAIFIIDEKNAAMFEALTDDGLLRSCYIDDADGGEEGQFYRAYQNLLLMPVDPTFFVAANLSNKEARSWDEAVSGLEEVSSDPRILNFRSTVCRQPIPDHDAYILNTDALYAFYVRSFTRFILHFFAETYPDASPSVISGLMSLLWKRFSRFVNPVGDVGDRLEAFIAIVAPNKVKRPIVDADGDCEEAMKPPPAKKAAPAKVSATQRHLAKASKGTTSIMAFFGGSKAKK